MGVSRWRYRWWGLIMPVINQIADFGKRGTGNAGAGLAYGLQAQRNRLAELGRQDRLEQQDFQNQQAQSQQAAKAAQAQDLAEQEFWGDRTLAIAALPDPESQSLAWQGVLEEANGRGIDISAAPKDFTPEVLTKLIGATGVDVSGGGLPSGVREFNFLTEGMTEEERAKAKRVKVGLDPRAVGAAQKNVMIAGVPHVFDPETGGYLPAAIQGQEITAADVAEDKATIAQREATAKAEGKSQGEAVAQLPQDLENADQMTTILDKALNHPGFDEAVGLSSVANPAAVPGSDRKDFLVILNQLKGKAFLQAFQSLKGGGHITEIEGQKATEAMARLDTAQSEKEFKEALLEMKGIVERGRLLAQMKAKGGQSNEQSPSKGAVEDGYVFLGGDPADPKNWKKQ